MGNSFDTDLAERIKLAKEKKDIPSYIDLGKKIGKTEQTIYNWMREGRIPKEKDQVALAVALGVSKKWLTTGEDPDGAPPLQVVAPSPKRSALFSALDFVHNLNQVLNLEFTPDVEVEEGWRVAETLSEYHANSVDDLPSDVQRELASQIGKRSHKK